MENLERQLEEIGVLEAIYPDELTVDSAIVESARELLEKYHEDGQTPLDLPTLSFTVRLTQIARIEPGGKLKHFYPSITLEFPQDYPEESTPIVKNTSGVDTEMMKILQQNLDEHSGVECTMQIVMSMNDLIQIRNESTVEDFESGIRTQEQELQFNDAKSDSKQMLGRRVINSPYILKPAKIKDIKKCADELGLWGFVKIGKPGIIVVEGPEEGCRQYCPMLEDRGWKYQKVQGEETQEGEKGETLDDLRKIHNDFKILPEDTTMSDLSKLCREAGIGDFFFASLNIHDSNSHKEAQKSGKR